MSIFKKSNKEQEKITWYVIESKKSRVRHIVEEKLLEVILADNDTLEGVAGSGYTKVAGWHEGKDGIIYERHQLNSYGQDYRNRLIKKGKNLSNYVKALEEMNNNSNFDNLSREKAEISWNFTKNLIKGVYKYVEKELKVQNQEDLCQ